MLELKSFHSLNEKKSGNQLYSSNIFVTNTLLWRLIFFLLAPGFLNQGLELRLEFESFLFTEKNWFGLFWGLLAKKSTILQNSLKRKQNHDAKTSEQLNHFYLDFLLQTLIIHRESEVREDHFQSFLPFSPAHKHSEVDLQVAISEMIIFYFLIIFDYLGLSNYSHFCLKMQAKLGNPNAFTQVNLSKVFFS